MPPSRRGVINTLIIAALISVLYRYWLVTPVLKYLSIDEWRLIAVVVAAASGCVLFRLRFSVPALACGSKIQVVALVISSRWFVRNLRRTFSEESELVSGMRRADRIFSYTIPLEARHSAPKEFTLSTN